MTTTCQVYRHALPGKGAEAQRGALLGNFDGLHVGHQGLLEKLQEWRSEQPGRELTLISFYPHPLEVVRGTRVPRLLSLRQKRELLSSFGIDTLVMLRFTAELMNVEAEDFVHQILVARLGIDCLFVGPDAAVGKGRKGDVAFLSKEFAAVERTVEVLPFIKRGGKKIGSALIRESIESGLVAYVRDYLGRPYSLEGRVLAGDKIGRGIGFPTANIRPNDMQIPATGVYATVVTLEGIRFAAVTNVGFRPTISAKELRIESHLLSYSGEDFYGNRIEVAFYTRIRDERRFEGVEELQKAIQADVQFARSYFEHGAGSGKE